MLNISACGRQGSERLTGGTRRLWSLWDMLILDAAEFMQLIHALLSTELVGRDLRGPVDERGKQIFESSRVEIMRICESLGLPMSVKTADNMLNACETFPQFHQAIQQITNTVMIELKGRKFYGPLLRYEQYYSQPKLFGNDVFDSFPSANDDIYEAGTCLALERSTACVMHLMRVLECGLAALANAVGVKKQNDWGKYIKEIGEELDRRAVTSGARSADEQFYAETAANFDRLRRAYRNPTMHPDKTYSQERAEEILVAVKSFMSHLPPRIFEF